MQRLFQVARRRDGKDDTDHQQQNVFFMVPAGLAAGPVRGTGVRRGAGTARRCCGARGNPAAVALHPRPAVAASGRDGVGYAGHCRVSQRGQSQSWPAARGTRGARALPRHLRRNALGLRGHARGAADEPEGALSRLQGVVARASRHRPHYTDLDRVPDTVWRPLPVRRETHHGRCDVCAGGNALCDLWRNAGSRAGGILQADPGNAGVAGMDRGRQQRARSTQRAGTGVPRRRARGGNGGKGDGQDRSGGAAAHPLCFTPARIRSHAPRGNARRRQSTSPASPGWPWHRDWRSCPGRGPAAVS